MGAVAKAEPTRQSNVSGCYRHASLLGIWYTVDPCSVAAARRPKQSLNSYSG